MTVNLAQDRTVAALMNSDFFMLPARMTLREASVRMRHRHAEDAVVVDATGAWVGVLPAAALAGVTGSNPSPRAALPRACSHQSRGHAPGGGDVVLCDLPAGACPLQQAQPGLSSLRCIEPHSVPCDWQVVEVEPLPEEEVARAMTTDGLTVPGSMGIAELQQAMTRANAARAIVLDDENRPIGFVTTSILAAALAQV